MTIPEQPLPAGGPSREKLALQEIEHTTVSPATVRLLLVCFLAAITGVPIAEWAGRHARGEDSTSLWSRLFELPVAIRSQFVDEGLRRGPEPASRVTASWRLVTSMNRTTIAGLSEFEHALDEDSLLSQKLRPPAQIVITGWLGAGNERVYRGRDGWLFYRPDVEYVTGPGFLDPAQLERRVAPTRGSANPSQPAIAAAQEPALSQGQALAPRGHIEPDPRRAIAQFRRDLEARGIALVVVPTPLKPGVHPEKLASGYSNVTSVLQNPSYRAFVEDLKRDGVLVFEPSEGLADARFAGPQYLATDSHWRPEAMEAVAERLRSFIETELRLPDTEDPGYLIERSEVHHIGDAARMLDLPENRPLFSPEAVALRRVLQRDGSPWRSTRDADVLVLGDSFSNIYSLESMGWGTSAGLAEQLSYALRRPVDRLVQNDEGAFATRAMLGRDSARLEGKRVLIYQFAARELAFGDWKVIPLPPWGRASR